MTPRPNAAGGRVELLGSFHLGAAPSDVFPLFTPLGERDWVPGWNPVFVHPSSGEIEENQVFLTREGDESTLWSVVRLDPERREVEYLRVTPGSRIARVEIRVSPCSEGSAVEIGYLWTALTARGRGQVEDFERGFEAMLAEWQRLTNRWLRTSGGPPR